MTDGPMAVEWVFGAAGALGQACFFARFLGQWIATERARAPRTPVAFWRFSLLGSALSFVYATFGPPRDVVFACGYAFNAVAYGRNLMLAARPDVRLPTWLAATAGVFAVVFSALLSLSDPVALERFSSLPLAWAVAGVLGQLLWSGRFFVQWAEAERSGRPELTRRFFLISLVAWTMLFPYACRLGDPWFVVGLLTSPFVIVRNLMFFARRGAKPDADGTTSSRGP